MKKSMMQALAFTAAVAMTTIAQAAQINWSTATTVMRDSDGNALAGAAVLLIQVDKGGAAPTLGWESGLTISGGNYLGKTTLNASGQLNPATVVTITGNWPAGDINVYGGAAYGEPGTVPTAGFGNTHGLDYYMVVFDSATISDSSSYAMVSLANKYSTTETGNVGLIFNTATGSSSTWEPIPEPTSVALLAIGVAAIGLRRRFRK